MKFVVRYNRLITEQAQARRDFILSHIALCKLQLTPDQLKQLNRIYPMQLDSLPEDKLLNVVGICERTLDKA